MSNEKGGKELTVPSGILAPVLTMENNLTINDILSVAVGKVEDSLRGKLHDSAAALKVLEKSIKDTRKGLDDASKSLMISCGLTEELKAVTAPLKKLFPRENFKALVSPQTELDRERSVVVFTYSMGSRYEAAAREEDFNPEILKLFKQLDQERDDLALEQAEQLSIRAKLSNIPVLERRYKGMIAEAQLQKSDQGKELLATLTLNIDEEIKKL